MNTKTKIISIANQKGGVGKTTTTMNLAAGLAKSGFKVLAIDFDPQANLSEYLQYQHDDAPTIADLMISFANNQLGDVEKAICKNPEGIDYIPSNIMLSSADLFLATAICREQVLKSIIRSIEHLRYDYILIDCLPSLGVLLTNALATSNGVIIPIQTQKFALDGLVQLEQVCSLVKSRINPDLNIIGVLPTMCDNTKMSKAIVAELRERYPDCIFNSFISRAAEAANSTYAQASLVSMKSSKLGAQYECLVAELIAR